MAAQGHDLTHESSLPSAISLTAYAHFAARFGSFFIEPDVLITCTVRQYRSDLSDQSALEIRVTI